MRRLECCDVADPQILAPTDAIVEVERTAICGSDLHVYHGREAGLDDGTVMGHEFVGRVVEAGSEVRAHKRGDLVLSPFTTNCGACFYCRQGLTARCERGQLYGWVQDGVGLHGGQAEYVRVPLADATLVPVPDGVSADEALLLGDIFSTGYYCALQAGVEAGGVYAIVGCGPVGLMAIAGARELGAQTLFALDSVPDRLEQARRFGATPIDYLAEDAARIVRDATQGRGADAVLEVVGHADALRSAYELVRPGGTISVVGVHTSPTIPFSTAEAYDKNLTLRVGRCPARAMLERLIPVARAGRYDLGSVFSHRMPLAEGAEAYRIFDEKRDGCTKVVLTP